MALLTSGLLKPVTLESCNSQWRLIKLDATRAHKVLIRKYSRSNRSVTFYILSHLHTFCKSV